MTDPTTPAPAKTMSETMTTAMTEQDARLIASYRDGANVWFTKAIARRILATRDALQAKTEECAHLLDLQRVADADAERVDKVCQIIAGHRDDYRRERDQARAERDEARAALAACRDGMNLTHKVDDVTCALCRRHPKFPPTATLTHALEATP